MPKETVAREDDRSQVQPGGQGRRSAGGADPGAELGTEHETVHRLARQLGYGIESVRSWVPWPRRNSARRWQ
jgi:transposase